MKFLHQTLIENNDIKVKNLPQDLRASIQLFEQKLKDYETAEEEDDEIEIRELKAELRNLSQLISSEIEELMEEDEVGEHEEDLKLPKDKEGILKYLYENNIRKVTKEDLKNYGYPIGFWESFPMKGETIGNYSVLRNNANEIYFTISKLR